MIKLFVYSLLAIVLALLTTLYLGFPADPGYLLLAFGNYTFETSLFALLVAIAVCYLFVRLLLLVWHWISPWQWVRYGRRVRDNRTAKSRSKTVEGMLCLVRGNWKAAYKLLNEARRDKDATVVNYLAAAQAAFELGDKTGWAQLLKEAEARYPAARSTINFLHAELLFKSNQLEQCLAVLEQLKKTSLNDTALLGLLKEVYIRLEIWDELGELLPILEKNSLVDSAELERIQVRLFMEQLYAAGKTDPVNPQTEEVVPVLYKLWKKAPGKYREDEKIVKHYAELLYSLKARPEAAKVLEHALSKKWSTALVSLYGERDYDCSAQQLLQAEAWLKARPADATLLLSLGRISMRNELWGKAREYFEASAKITPSADVYGELGRLLKHLGDTKASNRYLDKYSTMLGAALPELPLPAPGLAKAAN